MVFELHIDDVRAHAPRISLQKTHKSFLLVKHLVTVEYTQILQTQQTHTLTHYYFVVLHIFIRSDNELLSTSAHRLFLPCLGWILLCVFACLCVLQTASQYYIRKPKNPKCEHLKKTTNQTPTIWIWWLY